jgi:hypothetical protein
VRTGGVTEDRLKGAGDLAMIHTGAVQSENRHAAAVLRVVHWHDARRDQTSNRVPGAPLGRLARNPSATSRTSRPRRVEAPASMLNASG